MKNLFVQLIEDHRNIARVLELLKEQCRAYNEGGADAVSLSLILEALEYIQDYPEKFHHPLEELAFKWLKLHHEGDETVINKISEQHRDLEKLTARLTEKFSMIANACAEPNESAMELLQLWVDRQEEHLDTENRHIFPVMQEKISDGDWWDIASCLVLEKDPIFNDNAREYYSHLLEELQQQHYSSDPLDSLEGDSAIV